MENIKTKLIKTKGMQEIRDYKDVSSSVLTDDLDSLIACKYLKKNYSIPISDFYNKSVLCESCYESNQKRKIYVDCDLHCGGNVALGNHYTPDNYNELSVNPNMFLKNDGTIEDYCHKYAGSTTAMLYAMNGIEKLETNQLELLILLDGWYNQLYSNNEEFRNIGQFYINELQMQQLIPLIDKYDFWYWHNLAHEYKTFNKIILRPDTKGFYKLKWANRMNEDLFNERFGFDISLPEERFYILETFNNNNNKNINILDNIEREKIKSIAQTKFRKVSFSERDNLQEWLRKTKYEPKYLDFLGGDDNDNK